MAYEEKTVTAQTTHTPAIFRELASLHKRIVAGTQIADAVTNVFGSVDPSLPDPLMRLAQTCEALRTSEGPYDIFLEVLRVLDAATKARLPASAVGSETDTAAMPMVVPRDDAFDLVALADAYEVLWRRALVRQQESLEEAMQKKPLNAEDWERCASLAATVETLQQESPVTMRALQTTTEDMTGMLKRYETMLDNLVAINPSEDTRLLRAEFGRRGADYTCEPGKKKIRIV